MSTDESSETRELTYIAAVAEAVRTVLTEQDDAFVAGEDVAGAGGVFGSFRGLLDTFGEQRVVDTPISEEGIVGLGVGAAATGLRPVIDIMFMDFMGECMDEIANQMAKMRYMFGGSATLPITVLTMSGGGLNMAAQHSQSLEAWICHLPGLKVVAPSTPYDVKGLIISAARDDNPVFVVLNKLSLRNRGTVPEEPFEIELGTAKTVRSGSDVSIVTYSRMVSEAERAAEALSEDDIDAEIVDLRSLQPMDTEMVLNSVRKTSRAVVVHEAVRFGGLGGEIAAQIQEHAFDYLDAPVARVGAPFSPVPFSPVLEQAYLPNAQRIADEVRQLFG
ncbi:MAG: alpha-ketoacid dehydrogenase subunit beta [Gammaproteobacteria bacterium]|nr:alpha-ketoacid dehydrogenase subunit beta [Gammaproteobacteria bacterium]MYD79577.1 alpha-ketoacid dehydrogenase subunit beta [Gammaproteobacteria bacterium]